MHKLKIYVSESIMYGRDNFSNWLLIPSRPDDFFNFPTERYGMTNGSCPLVFACLQKSCKRFEHTYTVVHGSVNDLAIDRM